MALPGYWRPNPTSNIFSDCSVGFVGLDAERKALAKKRCCPRTQCLNRTFEHPTEQCEPGYDGALCLVCAKDYVLISATMECVPCVGGASLSLAFTALAITVCIPCFVVALALLFFGLGSPADGAEESYNSIGVLKILLSYVQIMGSMPNVMPSVPWPDNFISFANLFQFANFELGALFSVSSCSLAVSFPHQFLMTMTLPLLFAMTLALALGVSNCCSKKNTKEDQLLRRGLTIKMFTGILLFIYPNLCQKVFTMFRCKEIPGIEGQVLLADWSVRCNEGEHVMFSMLAFVFLGLFIMGIPSFMLFVLCRNRAHLHDDKSEHKEAMMYQYGGLYAQCQSSFSFVLFRFVLLVFCFFCKIFAHNGIFTGIFLPFLPDDLSQTSHVSTTLKLLSCFTK